MKMQRLIALSCFLLCFSFINCRNRGNLPFLERKLVGGADTRVFNARYMAVLMNGRSLRCSAVQIGDKWLTATAKCLLDILSQRLPSLYVRVGSSFPTRDGSTFKVARLVPNPGFNKKTLANNIGLILIIGKIVPDENTSPIKLISPPTPLNEGFTVRILGYGSITGRRKQADVLHSMIVPIITQKACMAVQPAPKDPTNYQSTFCTASPSIAACTGDAGGAAEYGGLLAGIISSGINCKPSSPTVIGYNIRVGTSNLVDGSIHGIKDKQFHPEFNSTTLAFNFGLVQLSGRGIVPNNNMKPISLLNANIPIDKEAIIYIYGYGINWRSGSKPALHAQVTYVLLQHACGYQLDTAKTASTTFCAANPDSAACEGDAGGAGVYRKSLAEIISSGFTCKKGNVIVLAKISDARTWIKNVTGV